MTETVVFNGLTKEEWNATLEESLFENFAYKETATTGSTGFSMSVEATAKFTISMGR